MRLAEAVGQRVARDAGNGRLRVLVHLAVLDVEAPDLAERRAGADELRDDGHLGLGVELHARAVEVLHAHAVAVEVASILVADALVAVGAVAAVEPCAGYETGALAGVRSVRGGDGVGLPDVHLRAAGAKLAVAGVGVVGRRGPALSVGLAVDPLDVVGALGVAVSCKMSVAEGVNGLLELTSSILGTSLVVSLVDATVGGHLNKVESTVQTAREVGNVNVEGELLVDEVEHLVLGVGLHEVGTGSDVAGELALGDELEGQGIARSRDTIGTLKMLEVPTHGSEKSQHSPE